MGIATLEGRRILVVEDDYMVAEEICDQLENAGATVTGPVPSVDRHWDFWRANRPLTQRFWM